jgi:beta-galactosidase
MNSILKLFVMKNCNKEKPSSKLSRRKFVESSATVVAGLTILPGNVFGRLGTRFPDGKARFPGEETIHKLSETRERIILNDQWKFRVSDGTNTSDEGSIRVPGAWYARNRKSIDGVVVAGSSDLWKTLNNINYGIYETEIEIPRGWAGREVLLNIDQLNTDAVVFVNNNKCGTASWPRGQVSLNQHIKPGEKNTIKIDVYATTENNVFEIVDAQYKVAQLKSNLSVKGLAGDIWLETRARNSYVEDVFIRTSVRKKTIDIDVDVVLPPVSNNLVFEVMIKDSGGEVVKKLSTRKSMSGTGKVTLGDTWENPKLWDHLQPNLYTMYLKIKGKGIMDEYAQEFGFREFWIQGKQLYLNNKLYNLRLYASGGWETGMGMAEMVKNNIDDLIQMNHNTISFSPVSQNRKGVTNYIDYFIDYADKTGVTCTCPLPFFPTDEKAWANPKEINKWKENVILEWRRFKNHPSVIVFSLGANRMMFVDDQNPIRLGNTPNMKRPAPQTWQNAAEILHRMDPTRYFIHHSGANAGDIYNLNCYLNLIPLQEREEWLTVWNKEGDTPIMMVEFGLPIFLNLLRGRYGFAQAEQTEAFLTEYCAIYFGAQSYQMETDYYRKKLMNALPKILKKTIISWDDVEYEKIYQKLHVLFIRNTYKSWRTYSIPGGMGGWFARGGMSEWGSGPYKTSPAFRAGRIGPWLSQIPVSEGRHPDRDIIKDRYDAITYGQSPLLVYIGGSKTAVTEKDHHFFPGDTVQKQVVFINDTRNVVTVSATVDITFKGEKLKSYSFNQSLQVGEVNTIPFEFTLPEVLSKTDGQIHLSATSEKFSMKDEFTFRVYPALKKTGEELLIFDPEGATSKLLTLLGYSLKQWDGKSSGTLLVIGRNAIARATLPGSIEEFMKHGGKAIVFSQERKYYRENLGMRICEHVTRRCYVTESQKENSINEGFDNDDLRDWNGSGTLVPWEDCRAMLNTPLVRTTYGWHWGNRGSVSSASVEKPHFGSFRPIIESEFALNYSPLMEFSSGNGMLLMCTFDVEGRDKEDPVAHLIVSRMISYFNKTVPTPKMPTYYIGDAAGRNFLTRLGVIFNETSKIPSSAGLVIIGNSVKFKDDDLNKFLENGGNVLFLKQNENNLPLGYRMENDIYKPVLNIPASGAFTGLSCSDFHIRVDIPVKKITNGPGEISANGYTACLTRGKGTCVLFQLTPEDLNENENPIFRYSIWRLTHTWSQIISNLGGSFSQDVKIIKMDKPETMNKDLSFYILPYREGLDYGDDPYRYFRW